MKITFLIITSPRSSIHELRPRADHTHCVTNYLPKLRNLMEPNSRNPKLKNFDRFCLVENNDENNDFDYHIPQKLDSRIKGPFTGKHPNIGPES